MSYPSLPPIHTQFDYLVDYIRLKHEYGAEGIDEAVQRLADAMNVCLEEIKGLTVNEEKALREPDGYEAILSLRPEGPRRLWDALPETYRDKLEGAFLARCAGCTLGAPVEFWATDEMKNWAEYCGDPFPPTQYWSKTKFPGIIRYGKDDHREYMKDAMHKVPVDDDVTYTLLGLLIAEDHGVNFTTDDVGKAWLKYLPYACTAEEVALDNLRKGIPATEAADADNPYCQLIGADIRSDPFAYMAPGFPEKAAKMAYADAYLSHRRNGIYGEMFFAAAQAAAFAVNDPIEAIRIGLSEIPTECDLARDVRWALEIGPTVKDYRQARALVEERFCGMGPVHTNLNACLTIFGLYIGGTDVTKVLSEIVAMGYDNDCTAATAGSIVGAIVGKKGIEPHWYECFRNTVDSYLIDVGEMQIDDVLNRFAAQAETVFA